MDILQLSIQKKITMLQKMLGMYSNVYHGISTTTTMVHKAIKAVGIDQTKKINIASSTA